MHILTRLVLFIACGLLWLSAAPDTENPKVRVKLHFVKDYGEHEAFAKKAVELLEKAVNTEAFKKRLLAGSYLRTNGKSNEELYQLVMNAEETQGPGGDKGVIDLRIRTLRIDGDESSWYRNCHGSTIGIDGNGDGVAAICPNVLADWAKEGKVGSLAGHYFHEYLHQIGFGHNNWRRGQTWREKTFVYKGGYLVRDIIDDGLVE